MIKKFRVTYWMLRGFLRRHNRLLVVGIFFGILLSLGIPRLLPFLPQTRLKEKIGIIGRPTLSQLPLSIQNEISLGLTQLSPSGEAIPSLSSSYSIEDSGKRYRFRLRTNAVWHDGKAFTSDDINYSFSDVTMQAVSADEVVFELKEPFAPFPTVVSQPLFRSTRSRLFPQRLRLLGLGSMRVSKIVRNGQLISELVLDSSQSVKRYRFYPTQEAAIMAFKLGEVDEIQELSSASELGRWPNVIVEPVVHPDRYVALFFNTVDPALEDKSVRQALAYTTPEKGDPPTRAISPVNPNSWAYNPQVKPYDFDLGAARRLLSPENNGEALKVPQTLELTTTLPYLALAEDIKAEWMKLGVTTTIKVVSFLPETFQVLLIAQEIPTDPDQYSLWHSTQATNLTHYNSPKVDKLLEDGRKTLEINERTLIYQDFQRFLVEDSPAVFLFHHQTFTLKRT